MSAIKVASLFWGHPVHAKHKLTAEDGLMTTLYGKAVVLLVTPDVDAAVVQAVLGMTVTNCPGTDDVFGSDSTVTFPGDRVAKLTVCPAGATGLALMTASGPCDGDLTPAGSTVTVLRGLAMQLGALTAGPTISVG